MKPPSPDHRRPASSHVAWKPLCTSAALLLAAVAKWQSSKPRESAPPILSAQPGLASKTLTQVASTSVAAEALRHTDPAGSEEIAPIMATAPMPSAVVPKRQIIGSNWKAEPDPALTAFRQWSEQYIGEPRNRAGLIEEGIRLARERRAVMADLIKTNPERALAAAVPLADRDQLPASVQSELEDRVSGFGNLFRVHTTPLPGQSGALPIDVAQVDGQTYEAHRFGSRDLIPSRQGASIHGIAIGNQLAVVDSPVRLLEAGESINGKIVNQNCPVSGQTVATAATGVVTPGNQSAFQVGNQFYDTCSPNHVADIDSILTALENKGESTQLCPIAISRRSTSTAFVRSAIAPSPARPVTSASRRTPSRMEAKTSSSCGFSRRTSRSPRGLRKRLSAIPSGGPMAGTTAPSALPTIRRGSIARTSRRS